MARPVVLSNGRLMAGLDEHGFVQDFYYPFVGLENMTSARQMHHKIGLHIDGRFTWLDDGSWKISLCYEEDALIGLASYESAERGIEVKVRSFVDSQNDVFCRRFSIVNTSEQAKDIRLFLHQVFQISRSGRGDTAIYVPAKNPYVLSARGNITFLAGLRDVKTGASFDQFAVGNYRIEGKAGTFVDAEDGELSGSLVEHGGVDSVLRSSTHLEAKAEWNVDYWVSASASNYHHASGVHKLLAAGGLNSRENNTRRTWQEWLAKSEDRLKNLPDEHKTSVRNALLIIKAHADHGGGVIASGDSSIYNYGRDYYNYVWPRDVGLTLMPLVKLGYTEEALKFLDFCIHAANPKGYLHHKYMPDGSIGSTWHPMVQNGRAELNIQEDETAIIVELFSELEKVSTDTEKLDEIYEKLIRPACRFMSGFIDESTQLPHASYDLWEQTFQTSAYTASIVQSALKKGSSSAAKRGDEAYSRHWQEVAEQIRHNLGQLYSEETGYFGKGLRSGEDSAVLDTALDSSTLAGLYFYAPLDTHDKRVADTLAAAEEQLCNTGPAGGVIRYRGDTYMLAKQQYPANPWNICTLWFSQIYSQLGRREDAEKMLAVVTRHHFPSGTLSEQLDPETGYGVGVAPLVWSHAELINAILELNKN